MRITNAAELAYEVTGSGQPIVWIHGFTLDQRQWCRQVKDLATDFQCITYDLRGFGKSTLPHEPYDHVEDLLALLTHLDLKSPHLVGLSLGGLIGHVFAARYPDRLASLTLISPGSRSHIWREPRPVDTVLAHGRHHSIASCKDLWLSQPLFASLAHYPQARTEVEEILADYSGWHFKNADMQRPYPSVPGPNSIRVPTWILRGGFDQPGYYDIAAELAAAIPQSCLTTYDDCGHMAPMEQPARFNADLRDFLAPQISQAKAKP